MNTKAKSASRDYNGGLSILDSSVAPLPFGVYLSSCYDSPKLMTYTKNLNGIDTVFSTLVEYGMT